MRPVFVATLVLTCLLVCSTPLALLAQNDEDEELTWDPKPGGASPADGNGAGFGGQRGKGRRGGAGHQPWGQGNAEQRKKRAEEFLKKLSPECQEKAKALMAEADQKREAITKEAQAKLQALRQEMQARRKALMQECGFKGRRNRPSPGEPGTAPSASPAAPPSTEPAPGPDPSSSPDK